MADDSDPVLNGTGVSDDAGHDGADFSKLLEKIRRLEEENKRLGEDNKRLGGEVDRLEKENHIFRKALDAKGIEVEKLLEENKDLKVRVNMNSQNSSKPPSSDGYKKPAPKSLRVKTDKKRGGQPGHPGRTITVPSDPDEIVVHPPKNCTVCPMFSECSSQNRFSCSESRYVVDAVVLTKVTEHRSVTVAECPLGIAVDDKGEFPENVKARVQYGDGFVQLCSTLNTYGAMSVSRISALVKGMFGVTISEGTVQGMTSRCAELVRPTMKKVRELLIKSDVVNFDETGVRVDNKLAWVHDSSNKHYTYLTVHAKRGKDGMDANGVLPRFKGIAVHDCLKTYWKYLKMTHATCGAHFLRELEGIESHGTGHRWPKLFRDLLLLMKRSKEREQEAGSDRFPEKEIEAFSKEYDRVMMLADRECPPPKEPRKKTRGRMRKGKERSLIERLQSLKGSVMMFATDFRVPFDNNQAERDVRNVKVKAKVAGCFRTMSGAEDYLSIMSYIGTARKHGIDGFKALALVFKGRPDDILIFS